MRKVKLEKPSRCRVFVRLEPHPLRPLEKLTFDTFSSRPTHYFMSGYYRSLADLTPSLRRCQPSLSTYHALNIS